MVVKVNYSAKDTPTVETIVLEAVFTKQHYTMSLKNLTESELWIKGWQ